jgi:NodT family efflux transporter outer membrane factor (OMF) lipoprotein
MSQQPRRTIHGIPALLWLAATLHGCGTAPQFERAQPPAASRYTTEVLALESGTADVLSQRVLFGDKPRREWWSAFGSAELDQVIQSALAGNPTLASVSATLAQAETLLIARRAGLFPEVNVSANAGRQKVGAQLLGGLIKPPPFTFFSVGPTVSYTLDYAGGVASSIEQQRALTEYQRQQLNAARLTLTGNVALQALSIAAVRAQIAAVETILQRDRDNLDLVRNAFDAGSVSRLDVLAAESQLARDETLLPPLRQQLSAARHALAVLAGQPPGSWSPPDFELQQFALPRELPVTLPSELARERPDILAAEAQMRAATAAVGVATANLYPRITLSAAYAQQSTDASGLFTLSNSAWSLIAGLVAPLFNAGRLQAERHAALYALRAAAASYQNVVLQAFSQVADVLTALENDAAQLRAELNALDAAQASADLTRASYQEGVSNLLQVLDADRQVQQARLGSVRVEAQRYFDTVELFLALGAVPVMTAGPAPTAP